MSALAGNGIERTDFGKGGQFGFLQSRDAALEVVDGSEGADVALANDFRGDFGAEAMDEVEAKAHGEFVFRRF
jgi:hypothetical protein